MPTYLQATIRTWFPDQAPESSTAGPTCTLSAASIGFRYAVEEHPARLALPAEVRVVGSGLITTKPALVKVVAEQPGAGGVAQLGHGLGFELSNAFAGDPVDLTDLLEGARLAVDQTKSQSDDAGFPLG